ncbi:phospho-sugar mutase [Anaeromicrobium sediminis]|uniref:phosphoglucomutase (alpha-D-glucose-1,6-bisphosphate-dependent) n=1 Tax=Anaeromicrobium sediminis TaxID=1478221 RepID=A0A267MFU0_9FIRM|nr:phospho-sugar mutase [Anaeromicrobium sediminis]PAB58262.1 phosphoglucomutase [Anaeromicrobium sediminis]
MFYLDKYNKWLESTHIDEETTNELKNITDNKEIEDRFYKDLEFGTAGLRGIIGAGTNRMNKYVVGKATQGYANYLIKNIDKAKEKGVVIAYDSRHKSPEFAQNVASVLNASGIKTYLFESLRPTPELSFSVRHLDCAGGILITASHNPKEYNGYKVYAPDGAQILPHVARVVLDEIDYIKDYSEVKYMEKEEAMDKGLLTIVGGEVDNIYIEKVKGLSLREDVDKNMNIVYTPLHGTGNIPVRRVLEELGYKNVSVVKEQELPDPDFTTVYSPNPEEHDAFKLAIELGEKLGADLLLGTDPDCDRVGAVVKDNKGEYKILTGNQTGALLVDYILGSLKEKDKLPSNGVIIKTIVTNKMGETIAKSHDIDVIDTLTGFKFIGEKIDQFEKDKSKSFLLGYEESYGYSSGTFVRDKDAVISSMLISEMAAYYKTKNMSLYDALNSLYEKYGYYKDETVSIKMEGKEGLEKIQSIIEDFRSNPPKVIDNKRVKIFADYKTSKEINLIDGSESKILLPESNVLHFTLEDDSWFCVRPSGTEPKIKIYFSVCGKTQEEADEKLEGIKKEVMEKIS